MLAQALLMLERAGLDGLGRDQPSYAHLVLEVLKGAFADREYRYGDPRFVDVGIEELLSDEPHRRAPGGDRSDRGPPRAARADRRRAGGAAPAVTASDGEWPARPVDTSYVCAIDRWGNAFSAVPSDGSTSSPVIPGTGLVPVRARACSHGPTRAIHPASPRASGLA